MYTCEKFSITATDTFVSKHHSTSRLSRLIDKMDFMGPKLDDGCLGIMRNGDALSPLLLSTARILVAI